VLISLAVIACLTGSVTSANMSDEPMRVQVENGLLPIAAEQLDQPQNIFGRMRAYGAPGVSIAIIQDGEVAWARGYGLADIKSRRHVSTNALFQAASISKPITAVGVLTLARDGRLNLDNDVNRYLKNWQLATTIAVTPRMLLSHTAGINLHGFEGYNRGAPLPTLLQILDGSPPANTPPVAVEAIPGRSVSYSGGGYEILQKLVEDVSGEAFDKYMKTHVLEPMGMAHSSFAQPFGRDDESKAATGYYAGGSEVPGRFRVAPELAAAGLWTTPTDVARYVISVQKSAAGLATQPLSFELANAMLSPTFGARGLGPTLNGAGESARFGHDGFNEGFESTFAAYVHGGKGAVVMVNSSFAFMLIEEIMDSISRAYAWPDYGETDQRPPDAVFHQQQVIPVPRRIRVGAVGMFRSENTKIQLVARGKKLFLEWPTEGTAEVYATDDGRLFCPPLTFSDLGSPWLRLVFGQNGKISALEAADDGSGKFVRVK
jgi:CubicO group peptidase (beta-lactamase class C family)